MQIIIEFKSTSEVSSVCATINVAWIPYPSNEVEVTRGHRAEKPGL
jgi:hypothetical protein